MLTAWGKQLDKNAPLPEYPRPQFVRKTWLNLNGVWEYAISKDQSTPVEFDGEIVVPFSPECELSGVGRTVTPDDTLWYKRKLDIPEEFCGKRVILHFGAVDQMASVFVNDTLVATHTGGYTPFSADITDALGENNTLIVKVRDYTDTSYHSRGKQKTDRGGIWYTAQSGIWQTVWLEAVPEKHIDRVDYRVLFEEKSVEVTVSSTHDEECRVLLENNEYISRTNTPIKITPDEFKPWSPEDPNLYDITLVMGEDRVDSYFALRSICVDKDNKGVSRLMLNGKPYFHHGLLDQGYWPDGLYTPPSDEAMIFDIKTAKELGFNTLRKHIKIEPMRWYYHCDRLGMLVWQDMINGGEKYRFSVINAPLVTKSYFSDKQYSRFGRSDLDGRRQYYAELREMITHLRACPCIVMWVPFNEGWGQFDAQKAVELIMTLDDTRVIDHASGWHDQKIGNVQSLHVYFTAYRFRPDKLDRAVMLTEFGGYNYAISGHVWNDANFGYKKYDSLQKLRGAIISLYEEQIIPAAREGLCAAIYTQLTDVEDEQNGILTYDRAVNKLDPEVMCRIASRLKLEY